VRLTAPARGDAQAAVNDIRQGSKLALRGHRDMKVLVAALVEVLFQVGMELHLDGHHAEITSLALQCHHLRAAMFPFGIRGRLIRDLIEKPVSYADLQADLATETPYGSSAHQSVMASPSCTGAVVPLETTRVAFTTPCCRGGHVM
jgi:hypothetical protein